MNEFEFEQAVTKLTAPIAAQPDVPGSIDWQQHTEYEKISPTHYRLKSIDVGVKTQSPLWFDLHLQDAGSVLVHDNGLSQQETDGLHAEANLLTQMIGHDSGFTQEFMGMVQKCSCTGMPAMTDEKGQLYLVNMPGKDLTETVFDLTRHLSNCLRVTRFSPEQVKKQLGSQIHPA